MLVEKDDLKIAWIKTLHDCLDNGKHTVYKSGQEIQLTPMEYNLLYLYYKKSG